MEPLSVTASVVAVLGAARRLLKGLGLLKAAEGAPASLDDLLLHLSGIEEVLQATQDVPTEPSTVSPGLSRVLGRTKAKFVEMESLIQYTLTEAGESSRVDRWQWLTKRDEIEKLRRQLDALRNDLTALISTQNLATLQCVSIHTRESWAVQQRHNHSLTKRLARSEAFFAFLCDKIEESAATQRELHRLLGEFRVTRLKPAIDQQAVASSRTRTTLPKEPEMRPRMRARSEIQMQTVLPLRKCFQECPCVCHKFRRVELPSKTSALFGSGSIAFRGFPFWRTGCNYRHCKQDVGPSIVINYFLPTWLSRTMLYAWFTSVPLCPPELLIRTYQVVPYDNLLVSAVVKGDLHTLQNAFATGNFSPYVLCESEGVLCASEGDTLLHLAAVSYSKEASAILRFLLSIGLDPGLTNAKGISAADYTIDKVAVTDPYQRLCARPLARIDAFPAEHLEDACERRGFSEIHKIVWGISYEDLDTKVRVCPKALDGADSYGYTPLDYAVRFAKGNHIRTLLSHGADIGTRPHVLFWKAVESGDYASMQLLLDRGLRPNDMLLSLHKDDDSAFPFGYFPLWNEHAVDWKPEVDRLLNDHGFNSTIWGSDGVTALMACCRRDSSRDGAERMKLLLEQGVDPEITDKYGQTAIHHALYNDNIPAFELPTEYGARLDAKTSKGETVLHMAIQRTRRVDMVYSLFKAGIMQLDLDARRYGKTAFNVLGLRAAETNPWYWAFSPSFRFKPEKFEIEDHVRIIRAFEALFQEIQEHQGVPLKDRYPALHIAVLHEMKVCSRRRHYPTSSDHAINEASDEDEFPTSHDSNETICAPPGAWPERG